MWTVGRAGSKSAMPRLPRVMSTAFAASAGAARAPGALERSRIVADPDAERLLRPPTHLVCRQSSLGTSAALYRLVDDRDAIRLPADGAS